MTDFDEEPNALVSVTPDTSVLAAMEIMTEQRIRCVVGVDGFWFFFFFFWFFFWPRRT
jgi:CBS domain-containing protein